MGVGPPRVSVVVAAYKPTYLQEALASVLAQSEQNLEVVVVDDSRGRRVEEIVRAAHDPRIRYLRTRRTSARLALTSEV